MTVNEALRTLAEIQTKISAYYHASGLIYYDGVTTAPSGTSAARGQTLSVLAGLQYELMTGAELAEALAVLQANPDMTDAKTKRIVELLDKQLRETRCIPMDEYVAYQSLVNDAHDVWQRAKNENDYAAFEPYLAKLVESVKRFAGYIAPDKHPYDQRLDNFEGGLTMAKCDEFFGALREKIVPLVKKIAAAQQVDAGFMYGDFPIAKQAELSDYAMELMGIDRAHCGISTTEHPFTIEFSKYDVRITTHYYPDNFSSSLFSVIHEGGHALYELHCADEDQYTALTGGISMGIHESQSRFYENIIGRSLAYAEKIFPKLVELFPEQMKNRTAKDFWRAVNRVEPSLIRIEADELTYALHIMVRYEIEKRLFSGELTTAELPAEWNRFYKEYLGVDVPDDTHGVLQDTHWSGGDFGYFPSYALGSAYGAQLLAKMRESVDVDACVAAGDFAPVNAWLEERIWKYGKFYEPGELFVKAAEGEFDPGYYTRYLEKKLTEVYGL
jgi:carboxypeptidase Taq